MEWYYLPDSAFKCPQTTSSVTMLPVKMKLIQISDRQKGSFSEIAETVKKRASHRNSSDFLGMKSRLPHMRSSFLRSTDWMKTIGWITTAQSAEIVLESAQLTILS
jgi:hypothetical protein